MIVLNKMNKVSRLAIILSIIIWVAHSDASFNEGIGPDLVGKNVSDCGSFTTCNDCGATDHCIWCQNIQGIKSCVAGGMFGPEEVKCEKWYWKMCFIETTIFWIIVGSIASLLILTILICLCRCMCCSGRRRIIEEDYIDFNSYRNESNTPKTDARRRELQQKYGVTFSKDRTI
eukprot:TRINITY_DN10124_c0_g1_i1.p1 TRINITY_DN10124_c0_g1~~TRINITY_DN10124_c0_g1_i1.p1  ORF type:complete len:174 (-),score=26.66 TRINITY_DN10124_c0_g1_i1:74-595(-)